MAIKYMKKITLILSCLVFLAGCNNSDLTAQKDIMRKSRARQILIQAKTFAAKINDNFVCQQAMADLAGSFALIGDYQKAQNISEKLEEPFRSIAVAGLALGYSQANDFERAAASADMIGEAYYNLKQKVLIDIATRLADKDKYDKALEIAGLAGNLVHQDGAVYAFKADILDKQAQFLAKAGDVAQAEKIVEDNMASIDDTENKRIESLISIAQICVDSGKKDKAKEALNRALIEVRNAAFLEVAPVSSIEKALIKVNQFDNLFAGSGNKLEFMFNPKSISTKIYHLGMIAEKFNRIGDAKTARDILAKEVDPIFGMADFETTIQTAFIYKEIGDKNKYENIIAKLQEKIKADILKPGSQVSGDMTSYYGYKALANLMTRQAKEGDYETGRRNLRWARSIGQQGMNDYLTSQFARAALETGQFQDALILAISVVDPQDKIDVYMVAAAKYIAAANKDKAGSLVLLSLKVVAHIGSDTDADNYLRTILLSKIAENIYEWGN